MLFPISYQSMVTLLFPSVTESAWVSVSLLTSLAQGLGRSWQPVEELKEKTLYSLCSHGILAWILFLEQQKACLWHTSNLLIKSQKHGDVRTSYHKNSKNLIWVKQYVKSYPHSQKQLIHLRWNLKSETQKYQTKADIKHEKRNSIYNVQIKTIKDFQNISSLEKKQPSVWFYL